MARIELDGLLAFPLTAFADDLTLDLDAFAKHVEVHIAAGAGALFVACGTGEFSSLSPDELADVLKTARDVANQRVPIWVGAGGGAAQAQAGVKAAEQGGADGVLLMPPYLVTGPPAGLVEHVRYAVGDSGIPVIVYHRAPGVFTANAAKGLVGIPNVVGLKDGFGDVDLMTRIVTTIRAENPDFLFFNGLPTAEVSAQAYAAIGVRRYSSAVHCFAPAIAHRFHRAITENDHDTAQALLSGFYLPLVALRDESPGFAVSLVKAAARLRGDKVGPVRPPLAEPTPDQLDRLARIVDDGHAALEDLPS
ncbi:5-dehydro-4-deoxyglucarate dehydratase [Labedaea rhizosphaerae]|uniref:Probable 5-dehydro-4-deoxyglucarate dehydratase n=1 Tax=Labedaea rhizosphaerae TaxID=598644 RepID=A0A4R6S8M6_LABRH|nr:5-dehydro-4-deoxyglucarate dehydratase [Labedaea rhizosphaerae]TDP95226.1 5-dehydro-4-deoxyglucarate dehydratase [Labedaea rhizosphaerae]